MIYRYMFLMFFCVISTDVYAGEVNKIHALPATQIVEHIENTKGKPRVVMIYTSWCPHCRRAIPEIMDIERNKPGSVIAVSLDDMRADFERYIKGIENPPFKIILSTDGGSVLSEALGKYGVKPLKGIPHYIVFDADNKVVFEGNHDTSYIDGLLK